MLANDAWNDIWNLKQGETAREANVFEDDQLRAVGLLSYVEQSFASASVVTTPPLRYDPARTGRQGRPRWLRAFIHPVKDGDGTVFEMALLLEDVTEREEAEEKVRSSEEKFRSVVENASELIKIVDLDGTLRYASPAAERVLGYRPEEMVGMNVLEHVHPEDLPRVLEETEKTLKEPGVGRNVAEYRFRHKDGSWRHIEATGNYLLDNPSIKGVLVHARDITARKRAEERLREAEERYRSLVEQVPAIVYIEDIETPITLYDSPQIEKILGYPQDTYRKDPRYWEKILHPEDRERVLAEESRAGERGELHQEYRVIARDGRVVWLRDEAVLVRDDEGRPRFWRGIILDITERKRAEEALQESEERFRTVVESLGEGLLITDTNDVVLYVNSRMTELTGYAEEEFLGSVAYELLLPPERWQEMRECIRERTKGTAERYETRLRRRDGSFFWTQINATPYRNTAGEVVGMLGAITGITERKQIEEALRESEDRFRTIFEQTALGISIADPDRRLLETNAAYQNMLGYSREELFGKPIAEISHPDDVPEDWELNEKLLSGEGDRYQREKRYIRKDGSVVWVQPTVSVVRDDKGEPQFLIGTVEDITERKEAEDALRESEKRFRQLFDQSVDTLLVHDETGRIVDCNAEACRSLGYSREEMLSLSVSDFATNLASGEEQMSKLGMLWQHTVPHEIDAPVTGFHLAEHRRKDGTTFPVEVRVDFVDYGGKRMMLASVRDITELKRAAEALGEREERFRSLIRNASDMITILDADGTIRYQSPAIERILGYGREDLVDQNVFDYIHPDDVQRMRERFGRTVSDGGVSRPVVYRFRHADGSWRYVESIANNLLKDPGVGGIVANSRDVTERELAEEALRERERRHRRRAQELTLLHRVRTTLARELDLSTVFRTVVEATAETFGYDQVSVYLVRDGTLVLQHQVGYERVLEKIPLDLGVMSRVVRSAEPVLLEEVSDDPDFLPAIEGIVSEVCVPLLDEGRVVGVLNVETTREPLAEEDLRLMLALSEHVGMAIVQARLHTEVREAEFRYRTLVENIPAVTYIQQFGDNTGRLGYISPQVEEVLGYTPEEYLSDPDHWVRTIHPEDRERVLSEDRRSNETGEPFRTEYRQIAKDGRIVWVRDEAVLVRGEDGNPLYWQGVKIDITDRKALEEHLEHQAFHDSLTGLPNRDLFMNRLEHALARTSRRNESVAVLFLDLDNFKFVNDSLGHEGGDRLLAEVARRLTKCVRPEDTVARLGGDEFAILLEGASTPDGAVRVAKRISEALRAPLGFNGHEVFTSTSIGIAFDNEAREEPTALLRKADLALYEAKRRGKAGYKVFGEEMNNGTFERLELEGNLRRAIEHGEFRVYYQPKVSLGSGRVVAFEALVRWDHPERGLLEPERFLPIAEETGLILPIGEWVLKEACRQGREWQETCADRSPPQVSVNISKRQFTQPDLTEKVVEALEETGLEARSLSLEISEGALMAEVDATMGKLRALKDLDVQLIIDDFGTAYSSLSQVKRFPLDMLGLDRSLIARLGEEPEDAAIVAVMIELAHALGWAVTAQGVETAGQSYRLRELDCDLAQGFHFSGPVTAGETAALIAAGSLPG